jgi:hypothetical protein
LFDDGSAIHGHVHLDIEHEGREIGVNVDGKMILDGE